MDENEIMIRERITALESACKSLQQRVVHIEELIESVQKMTVEMQHMREDINKMSVDLSELERKPAKRWDSLVSAVLGALAGGLGTALITMFIGG